MYIEKARESLRSAQICFDDRLYNSTVNRAYYAMFQAAIVALERIGVRPKGKEWSHEGVQAAFAEELTRRRKIYPRYMVRDLLDVLSIRNQADYKERNVSKQDASDSLDAAQHFVTTVIDEEPYG